MRVWDVDGGGGGVFLWGTEEGGGEEEREEEEEGGVEEEREFVGSGGFEGWRIHSGELVEMEVLGVIGMVWSEFHIFLRLVLVGNEVGRGGWLGIG